ncbi:hypothetical protein Pkp3OU2_2 [Klebsiella phage vB_KpnP_Ou2]|nr:hypothetical protein Pkp3OU2_2 [Klebsiella phage vB_KpnP_Ou2]
MAITVRSLGRFLCALRGTGAITVRSLWAIGVRSVSLDWFSMVSA